MELPKKYAIKQTEDNWCADWDASQIYAWDPARGRDETFVIDTPPPTVSGSLHVGHLFSYSHQDFIARYQRMLGKNIFFPIGWDDNGLPTERRVQNLLNVKCEAHLPYDPDFKPDPKKKGNPTPISRRNFVELCDEVIVEDEKAFKSLWSRLGLSYDWEQEYATINEHCRRLSQWSFLDLLDKSEMYQDERPVMWDVDFQTAIAQAELVDKDEASAYHFLRFGIQDADDHLVIATTRPELLAACVAVLVHPEDERFQKYVGKNAVTPLFKVPVPIMTDEKADPEKGTGVVMVCTFGDQTDVEWQFKYGFPIRQIIGRDGHLMPLHFVAPGEENQEHETRVAHLEDGTDRVMRYGPGRVIPSLDPAGANAAYADLANQYTKKARRILLEQAEADGTIIDRPKEDITHAVKFFEKGDRALEFVPTRQWYTKIMDKKEELLGQGRKIKWHPEFMIKRFEHWVEGLNQDWCISRQRYFGVPIPVWYQVDEHGAIAYDKIIRPAMEILPVDPLSDAPEGYVESQRDQPGGFTGDPDVMDTWATSSLTPQVATHWVTNPDRHQKLFPMDMRPQSHEIIRTWAFYTIVKAYLHEREVPWHNVVISGWILDPDRKKMSKSHGNVVTPEPLIDEHGADSVRYWAARARLGVDTAYDEQLFKVGRKLVTKLFNASKFTIGRFADIPVDQLTPDKITATGDRAVIAELRPVIDRATKAFNRFDYAEALSVVEGFFWKTFCDNYLELAKGRTYDEELTEGRLSAGATLRLLHRALLRMFAPFIPYITEEVWHWAYSDDAGMKTSVHVSPWPTLDEFSVVPAPEHAKTFNATVAVLDIVRRAKADANISMAAPVAKVVVTTAEDTAKSLDAVTNDIKSMLKIETLEIVVGDPGDKIVAVETTL